MGTYMPYVDPFIVIPPSDMIKLPDGTGQRVIDGTKQVIDYVLDVPAIGPQGAGQGRLSIREGITVYATVWQSVLHLIEGSGEDKTVDDILDGAAPGRETKGKTQQWEKSGGQTQA